MKIENTRVIEKIRKLLNMAEHAGSNEQEAAIAARQAQALLKKHNLAMTDISPEEAKNNVQENIMAKYKWTAGRAPIWAQSLAVAIADAHDTFVVWRAAATTDSHVTRTQQHLCFVGAEADVIVSGEVFNYLFSTINKLCYAHFVAAYIPAGKGKTFKNSYRAGMASRFIERFREMTAEKNVEFQEAAKTGTSLVVVKRDAIADYLGMKAEYGRSKRKSSNDSGSYAAGYHKGGSVSFNKQLH